MNQIELSILDYNKIGEDHPCVSCEGEFFVMFSWHVKFVKCSHCGEVYEVVFV